MRVDQSIRELTYLPMHYIYSSAYCQEGVLGFLIEVLQALQIIYSFIIHIVGFGCNCLEVFLKHLYLWSYLFLYILVSGEYCILHKAYLLL